MDWDGLLVEARPIPCRCGQKNRFRIIYYINADVVPNYREELIAGESGVFACEGCGVEITLRAPIIADFPSRDLVVFATPAGDDEGVDNGFRSFFAKLRDMLPSEIAESIARRPYTFVEGRRGLNAFVGYLHGDAAEVEEQPQDAERFEAFQTLNGYAYGDLFFYFPGQLPVQELVGLVVGAALDLEEADESLNAVQLLRDVADRIGYSHPWLAQELGRFLLITSNAEANIWLNRATIGRHSWIAVTRSFFDATPRRRADGPGQHADLPHALPATQLGSVTRTRHTVLGYFPASRDTGLWQFPRMTAAAIQPQYTEENIVEGLAVALGEVDRFLDADLFRAGLRESTDVNLAHTRTRSRELLARPDNQDLFWSRYVRARWSVDIPGILELIALPDVIDELEELSRICANVLRKIREDLRNVPLDRVDVGFSASNAGYVSSDLRFFLDESSQYIRRQMFSVLSTRKDALARFAGVGLYESTEDVAPIARTAFDDAIGAGELTSQFRVFLPPLARLRMAEISVLLDGEQSEESRCLDRIREFSTDAFERTVSQEEIDFLRKAASELVDKESFEIASTIEFFVDRLLEEIDADRSENHCSFQLKNMTCLRCKSESTVLTWEVINTLNRPGLYELARSGSCLHVTCLVCGAKRERTIPLFYCDPVANLYLLLFPEMNEEGEERLRKATNRYLESLSPDYRGNRPLTAFVSKFEANWNNAEQYVIVSRVTSFDEFLDIVGGILNPLMRDLHPNCCLIQAAVHLGRRAARSCLSLPQFDRHAAYSMLSIVGEVTR